MGTGVTFHFSWWAPHAGPLARTSFDYYVTYFCLDRFNCILCFFVSQYIFIMSEGKKIFTPSVFLWSLLYMLSVDVYWNIHYFKNIYLILIHWCCFERTDFVPSHNFFLCDAPIIWAFTYEFSCNTTIVSFTTIDYWRHIKQLISILCLLENWNVDRMMRQPCLSKLLQCQWMILGLVNQGKHPWEIQICQRQLQRTKI